ncbi:MAG: tRNA (N(6)-L-threonylcarbamoyladenosine(37)-C(2))-methylthiotransferase MtaB [Bacteriovoracaceae bacterium]|nr:tRNA (N(6)-L-threonylcarbamoyladenosine(37)-C(2))-methylthiotransferase MtaB [Bacteriovoracaceae bacterium]
MELNPSEAHKRVALHTLGCRLNFSETGSIAQGFVDRGYEIVELGQPADLVFLNTCTVTDGADSSCRNLIRKARASAPDAKIVVAGCYAQMEAEKIKKMEGVDLILGTSEKYRVFDHLDALAVETDEDVMVRIDKSSEFWGAATTLADSHTRAFLKIQDGCNYICSFCIIPFARGRSRTQPIKDVIAEANKLVSSGFKEVVLTGVNVGEYEASSGEKLSDLCQQLVEIDGLKRLRLSSVEPNTINEELLKVLKNSGKYLDHFHIPLQSGSDSILKNMRRKYDVAKYKEVISMVTSYFPKTAIGADIIAGFPGESEEQFLETFNLLRELPITHFHVFPFSKRQNTTAAKLPDQVSSVDKKRRVRDLIMLGEAKLDAFAHELAGSKTEVLFESQKEGWWEGYTPQFIKVRARSNENLSNQIKHVSLMSWNGSVLDGIIL